MKLQHLSIATCITALLLTFCESPKQSNMDIEKMMIRIAEIELDSNYVEEYIAILKVESEASVRLEPGVICIYPMYERDNPAQIKLLEIYADRKAYESHLTTPHFLEYKTSTLKMVKSLKLIDMEAIDPETMSEVFSKIQ